MIDSAIASNGSAFACSTVSSGTSGRFVRRRAIIRSWGRARSSASSAVEAATTLAVTKVRGPSPESFGWNWSRYSRSACSKPSPEKWLAKT